MNIFFLFFFLFSNDFFFLIFEFEPFCPQKAQQTVKMIDVMMSYGDESFSCFMCEIKVFPHYHRGHGVLLGNKHIFF